MVKTLWFGICAICLSACSRPQPLKPAFFYWETRLEVSDQEKQLLDSLHCETMYLKILDIGLNGGNIEPYARLDLADSSALQGRKCCASVFITNEVFENISPEKSDWLAGKILESAASMRPFDAFLIDCDWTGSTREAFFLFLKKLKNKLGPKTPLSATIRLHQYKFPDRTGVPPVDRGMLMFYNTGDLEIDGDHNSVFHPDDALKYLDGAPDHYPLPLDLALPLFSWGVVFREGEFWKIIPGPLPLQEMRSNGKWTAQPATEPFGAALWQVNEGTFLGGHYLRPGDRLRLSAQTPQTLTRIAELARRIDLADDADLAFFHLGVAGPEHFSAALLDSVCHIVRK